MLELDSKATLSRQENPGDGCGDSRTAKGASLGVAGEEALEGDRGCLLLTAGRMDLTGMGWDRVGWDREPSWRGYEGRCPTPQWECREKASLTQLSSSPPLLTTTRTR